MQTKLSSPVSLITIMLLIITFIASYFSIQVPEVNETPKATDFSATKAIKRLKEFLPANNMPHPVNSDSNLLVRDRIIHQINELGISTEIQDTTGCSNFRSAVVCAKVDNIIATIPGTDSSTTVLMMAHYDSHPSGPGAADAGHAVAIIIELLDMLKKQPPLKNDLVVLINEGEESGLLGAEAFMANHPLAKTIDVVVNMEARGNQGKSLLFETGENNYGLIKLYQEYAKEPMSNSISYEIYKLLPNDTDLTVTKRYDITGVNFAFSGRLNHYHTALDNIENLSPGSVQHQGDNAYAMLVPLLSTDLNSLTQGNAVYTDILSSFMIVWPVNITIPLTFFALLLLVLIAWKLVRSNYISKVQLASSLPFAFAIIIISALSSYSVLFLVQLLAKEAQPWLVEPLTMRIAIWLLPLSASLFFASKLKDKLGFWGLVMAANILLVVISMATSLTMPGVSYLTLLPLLIFSVLMSITLILGKTNNTVVAIIITLSLLAMALIVFPFMLLLENAMGLTLAPVFGVLISLVIILALPLLTSATAKVFKQLLLTTLSISVIGLLVTTQLPMFSKDLPQALNFEYLQQGNKATVSALTPHPLPQKMIAESAFSNNQKITRPWSRAKFSSIEVNSLKLPEPELNVISATSKGNEQQFTVQFNSKNPTGQFMIYSKDNNRLQNIVIDSQTFKFPRNEGYPQYFICKGKDCEGVTFVLTISGTEPIEIGLIDYSFGLPESLKYIAETRGELAHQIQTGDVSLVHKLVVLSADQ
ncbi:MAG: hypothetical protein ACI9N9_002548 [Enterobacterales bacterium]|jgi:hypothetical protein